MLCNKNLPDYQSTQSSVLNQVQRLKYEKYNFQTARECQYDLVLDIFLWPWRSRKTINTRAESR